MTSRVVQDFSHSRLRLFPEFEYLQCKDSRGWGEISSNQKLCRISAINGITGMLVQDCCQMFVDCGRDRLDVFVSQSCGNVVLDYHFFANCLRFIGIMLVMFFSQIVRLSWYIKTIDKYESGLFPKRQDFKLEICGHSPQIFHQQIRRAQSEAISFVNVGISSMLLPRLLWVKYVAGNFRTVVWLPIAVIGIYNWMHPQFIFAQNCGLWNGGLCD